MRERTFLPWIGNESALNSGLLIKTKSCAPNWDTSKLKCAACLYAKPSIRSPSNQPPHHSPVKCKTLETNHLKPGNCITANHYFSPIQGCLPHSFGKEQQGCTCGSLFIDHASEKNLNFPHYSNTENKTIHSATRLEAMAQDEGFKIKSYHSNNRIFAVTEFKHHCDCHRMKYSFSGVVQSIKMVFLSAT